MLLALDTSAGTSVAVVDEGRIIAKRSEAGTRGHAELIGRLMVEVLDAAGTAAADLSAVAVGMGPGPFTGLRVGIAAARAFAFGIGRPVFPIASHDAVAYSEARAGSRDPLLVVTDARRREIAWSSYAAPDAAGLPVRLAGPALALAATFPEVPLSGPDRETLAKLGDGVRRVDAAVIPAGALGLLAEALERAGRPFAADEPLYLRAPDVTLSAPKRVS